MRIGAVVLHYQGWPTICSSLDTLLKQSTPPETVVVVDNGSCDGSFAEVAREYPSLLTVQTGTNLGYAGGMNCGLRALVPEDPEAVLLLTQDCILRGDCLQLLSERLEMSPRLGAVGPLLGLRSDEQVVWSAGGLVDSRRGHTRHLGRHEAMEAWVGRPAQPVDWLDGACLLLRRAAVEEAGYLAEKYFMYFEETEYLVRLGRLGWGVECLRGAVAYQEPGEIDHYLLTRNQLGFVAASASKWCLGGELARTGYTVAKESIRARTEADKRKAAVRRTAVLDFVRGRWGPARDAGGRQ